MLSRSQHSGVGARLGVCARKILASEAIPVDNKPKADDFRQQRPQACSGKLDDRRAPSPGLMHHGRSCASVRRRHLIRRALEVSKGSVTRAARLLGITHQGQAFIINGRHKSLLAIRTPVKTRRRSIIRYR
jgi:transcriptional regulator with GAF, ATPase, and Fis domain